MGAHRPQEHIRGRRKAPRHKPPRVDSSQPWTRRLEAMLLPLLLTLALLRSPTYGAGQLYGFQSGTYFHEFDLNGEKVTAFRVATGVAGKILSIQGKFGNSWGSKQGISGGQTKELELWTNEYITEIHGSYIANIWYLVICTNCNRCVSFGKKCGQEFSAFPSNPGQVLAGFYGYYGLLGIRGIAFEWADPPENSTAVCSSTSTS